MTTFFRHYKNRYYQIVGEALDTRDDTLVVVYRSCTPPSTPSLPAPKKNFSVPYGAPTAPNASASPPSSMPSSPKTPGPVLSMRWKSGGKGTVGRREHSGEAPHASSPFPFKAIRKRDGMAAMAALRAEPCRPLPGTAKERNRRERT